jgi:uncharacterized protein (TIGR00251 family)
MRYEIEVIFHKDFVKMDGNKVLVGITSKPERGKANREIVRKLAKHFNVSRSQIQIVSGLITKRKIIERVSKP